MSQEQHPDRWHNRDFPVLLATARALDEGADILQVRDVLPVLEGLSAQDVITAYRGLVGTYVVGKPIASNAGLDDFIITNLTEQGRRAVGIWPSGEAADALIDALRQAEALADDPDDKSALRKAAGQLASVSRNVVADLTTAYIRSQTGI